MTRPGIADVLPLSPLQEGLLFHSLYDQQGVDAYTVQLRFDLDGDLDPVAMRAAARGLLRRHPNLRAAFRHAGLSRPVQLIPHQAEPEWREVDLSGSDDQESELDAIADADRARRFDMTRPPLVRFTLVRLGRDRHRLVLTNHHILIDGWSMPILVRELFELYARGGDEAGLPPVTPYKHYLAWLARQDRAGAEQAWGEALAGVAEPTLIAPDAPAPSGQTPRHLTLGVDAATTAALREQARKHGLTVNTVVQGAWALLLARHTNRDDVVFGATVSGRPPEIPGVESMVGLFINTLPVRVRLRAADSLADALRRVQDEQSALMAHHHLGLTEVQRLAGHPALFDTIAVFENYPLDPAELQATAGGVRVAGVSAADATHYPLGLIAGVEDGELTLRLDYRPEVFDVERVRVLGERLVWLFTALAEDLDRPVGRIDALTPAEVHRVVDVWNDGTGAHPAADTSIAAAFARQAAATPDAVAVAHEGTRMTYRELDEAANRVAHLLAARGAGPERFVALAMPRSADMVVALLAVLKAGAAYLPLDPDYPAERLAYMIADAAPALVVGTEEGLAALPDGSDVDRLVLDSASTAAAIAAAPTTAPEVDPRPEHPAYVIYTSGSTGRPKGVVIPHGNVLRLFSSTDHWFHFGPDDAWTLFHSYAFDFSVWELWGPLLHGGKLVVVPYAVSRSPEEFLRLLVRERVTVLNQTPSAFSQLMQADRENPELGARLALRYVVFGGEALDLWRLADWYSRHDDRAPVLVNMYGITETTVHVSHLALDAPSAAAGPGSMIGRSIPDLRIYVLDGALRPVAPGVVGEMYVAGEGLARGYHGQPALTAARFVADPFQGPGARMYRSGDLAKWTEGGELEFIGRADSQVKIRGFRIELGEIESVLGAHPSTGDLAVVVREDQPGDKRLVAYAVPAAGQEVDVVELRAHVAAAVPEHMVPSAFVVLDALPLTPNGKLDRKALPAPERGGPARAGRAPRDPAEELLCGLFAEVLGLPSVAVDESFFDLGGHSLLATRLISRVRAAFGVELAIRALFEAPTAAALAARLSGAGAARPPARPRPRPEEVPLSFGQRRLWFLNRFEGPSAAYNMPLTLRLRGELDVDALRAALGDVVARHEALRTRYPDTDGTPRQEVVPAGGAVPALPVTEVDELGLDAAVRAAAGRGFDLAVELPVRAHLFATRPDDHLLLLVVHHIAADGWSMAPLARDLSTAYEARRDGREPAWRPLPVQYADYALWQRELLGDVEDPESTLARQVAFWKGALGGAPEELALPVDRPRPAVSSQRGGCVEFELPADLHARLLGLVRESRTTLFMVLQAGLAALLARLGAGADVPIGTVIAGRTDEAFDELVGFFVNTTVLRTDVSGDPAFAELLERVRETDLAAFANQDIPFERLVDAVSPERSTARHPLFQVLLTLQNNPAADFDLPGLRITAGGAASPSAKFDLSLGFEERTGADGEPRGVHAAIDYAEDLFDESTVADLGARLVRVLEAMAADPKGRVGEVDLLGPEERRRLLVDWNGARRDVPVVTLPERFQARAAADPGALALICGTDRVDYGGLNARANRLARLLVERGAGPERYVAIALPRSVELVVALLAVLKAGAAYLPVDPEYPADRIRFMLADTAPELMLTSSDTPLPAGLDVPRLLLDDPAVRADVAARAATDLADADRVGPLRDKNPAYVIYTSGSTGRPKGVVIEHDALSAYLAWTSAGYPSTTGVTVLHSPISFDLTVTGLYTPLVSGGTVLLAALEDDETVRAALAERECTFLKATPSHLALLSALPTEFSPTGHLLLGGEMLLGENLAEIRSRRPGLTVLNVYGQTETTVNCTENRILPGEELPPGALAVGRPFDNMDVHVLDAALRPVPPGVAGEVYVAGTQVGRGYLNRHALTAERFVANPFGPPGSRMYRSGDLAKRRADGDLVFLGRVDDQVKVRGFRIELGEIGSVVVGHPGVARAAVVVREDKPGDKRIVAYLVPEAADPGLPDAVREHAAATLPEHMVPSAFVVLDALPLTPNGKLDRKALPAPAAPARAGGGAPRTRVEEVLCGLFAEVLGLDGVGIDDNFFELGGDSIISIQLVSRARKAGVVVTPRNVFEAKTVAALAALSSAVETEVDSGPDVGTGTVALTPALHRFRERGGPIARFNQSMLLQAPAGLTEGALVKVAQAVLDRHDALRMRLDRDATGSEWAPVVPEPGAVPAEECVRRVPVAGLTGAVLRDTVAAFSDEAWDRTDPAAGRMLQLVWFDGGTEPGRVLVVAHHLAVDGVSWRIITEDLAAAWEAVSAGREPGLQPVGTSFRRWAEHLTAQAHADERVAELGFWSRIHDEYDPLLGDRPLDPTQDTIGAVRYLHETLPPALTAPLLTTVPGAYRAGVNDVLLTGLALAVAGWRAEREDGEDEDAEEPVVLVDLEGHGREEAAVGGQVDLSRTVGWFTSRYPVRLDPGAVDPGELAEGGPAVGAALKRVKEQLRQIPDSGLGYGLLRYLNHDTRAELADVLDPQLSFNYLGRYPAGAGSAPRPWAAVADEGTVGGADLAGSRPDPATPLTHALSVNAVTEDRADGPHLVLVWSWPQTLLVEADVRALFARFVEALRGLVAHVDGGAAGGLTPSDTGLVRLSQDDLDRFETDFGADDGDDDGDDDGFEGDEFDEQFSDEWEMAK